MRKRVRFSFGVGAQHAVLAAPNDTGDEKMWHKSLYDIGAAQDAGTAGSMLQFRSDDGAEIRILRFGREHQMIFTYRCGGFSVDLTGSQCDGYGEAPSRIFTVLLPPTQHLLAGDERTHASSATFRKQLKTDLVSAFSGTRFFADFPLIDNVVFYQELPDGQAGDASAESLAAVLQAAKP